MAIAKTRMHLKSQVHYHRHQGTPVKFRDPRKDCPFLATQGRYSTYTA